MTEPPPPPHNALITDPAKAPFFSVSLLKFAVLHLATFGTYEIYWAYQNWKIIKERTNENILPFWRALFGVIWIYPLLRRVREKINLSKPEGENRSFPAGLLAITWIIIGFLYKLPDPWWLLSSLSFIPLLIAQSRINRLNAALAPQAPFNSRFTWANWIWIVVGIVWIALVIYGLTLPDNP